MDFPKETGAASSGIPGAPDGLIETILGRRSHRVGFSARPITRRTLETIIACGHAAPSSKNAQPWRFHVVADSALIRVIANVVRNSPDAASYVPTDPDTGLVPSDWESTVVESAEVLLAAPAAIFVENLGRFSGGRFALASAHRERFEGGLIAYALECAGLGGAVQNLWLAAEGLGLKACFMGDVGVAEAEVASLLGFDGDLLGVLALGFSDLPPEPKRALNDDTARTVWHPEEGGQTPAWGGA